ncbi:CYTH and CHAD domain-containing protein [Rhodoferax fermentans]|uniref:Inorganic triphosphatase n=1 Tax=Rhodoferax fermentans TaxID=28066 RepID=A0A1T1ARB6_RHOFE|nr:CYTH and CHAD domain-containing protein [Rhodoferax fermentans]MBK1684652.1 hypothetical protein [Rhodoferax fermentans]OOV06508.1 hypothetical protein RF819_06965 [Rhodoferax fermentans]
MIRSLSRQAPAPQEIELKLSLPMADPARLATQLAQVPALSRHQATHQTLHNIYYDTPDQQLRQQHAVLRLRRVGSSGAPRWLQTFKMGSSEPSALSRRSEWETPVAAATLSHQALKATTWSEIDSDGSLFAALAPCFVTHFERTLWLVQQHDNSVVEVALDLGQIEALGQTTPICELELELKAGEPSVLFDIAHEIAHSVAVLPSSMSKGQRGYALAQAGLNRPYRAPLPNFSKDVPVLLMAQQVLRHALTQFTTNLESLLCSDDPEVLHQARVGWRRFKSARQMFRKLMPLAAPQPDAALHGLLTHLGELRNLDVARTETLPALAEAFILGDPRRAQAWQTMMTLLTQLSDQQRETVRQALQQADVGASLLAIQQWLENLPADGQSRPAPRMRLRGWVKQRMQRLNRQLDKACQVANTPAQWHQVRILAKRLRYGTENLQGLMPPRLVKLSLERASTLQSSIGASRDTAHISTLMARLALEPGVAEFLRGFSVGATRALASTAHSAKHIA